MKKNAAFLPLILLCIFSISYRLRAQNVAFKPSENSGEDQNKTNDAQNPCLTVQQYEQIEKQCAENSRLLGLAQTNPEGILNTALNWPLKPANGLNDCSYYFIGAYVDQNTAPGLLTDYNCGSKTYDGHGGTDIATTPFGFYKMENNQVEVIAAAAGILLDKGDGNSDRNCSVNSLPANYVIIQHPDGSRAMYWHMKKNSVTTKSIGQAISSGEYLGVVGSSGSSSGPHLHFEVWNGSTSGARIDPYSGTCNSLNGNSWWVTQKSYTEPAVVKASVHTTDIVLPGCPTTETPNESSCYALPFQGPGLPSGWAKFYVFMRNETAGLTGNLSILNPDGSVFNSWTYTSTSTLGSSWRGWTKPLPTISGSYTFKAIYNGISCSSTFDVLAVTITANGTTLSSSSSTGNQWYLNGNLLPGATAPNYVAQQAGEYTVVVTNVHGCTAGSAIFNFNLTGTGISPENNPVSIFPNPNNGMFTIRTGELQKAGGNVEIYNLLGSPLFALRLKDQASEIDISALPSGIYVVKISLAKGEHLLNMLKL